jgi:hypothetical protein
MLYLSDESAAGRPSAGGYAIAAAFGVTSARLGRNASAGLTVTRPPDD